MACNNRAYDPDAEEEEEDQQDEDSGASSSHLPKGEGTSLSSARSTGLCDSTDSDSLKDPDALDEEGLPPDLEDGKKETKLVPVSLLKMYGFASSTDRVLILVGVLSAILSGGAMPVLFILLGDLLNTYVDNAKGANATSFAAGNETMAMDTEIAEGNSTETSAIGYETTDLKAQFQESTNQFCLGLLVTGLIQLSLSYLFVTCMNIAAENQVLRIRKAFLKAVLKQEIGWYDTHGAGSFASNMTEDLNKMQEAIGEKVGMIFMFLTTFVVSMVIAFIFGWKLTLVIFSMMPVMMVTLGLMTLAQSSLAGNEAEAYGKAGKVAEEVLGALRTVTAFGGQQKELIRYSDNLKFARSAGIKRGLLTGVSGGSAWFLIFAAYALAFWYGIKLIMDDIERCQGEDPDYCVPEYDPKSMIIVFFSVLMGAIQIGQSSPHFEAVATGRGAAASIFNIIERVPSIDSSSDAGLRPKVVEGEIEFRDVDFSYPSRPSVQILRQASFTVEKGMTVALVGASGCGKSTCIQLLLRFYDTLGGGVYLDGVNVKDLNVRWLRQHIGIVSQEPVLFNGTVRENIKLGKEDGEVDDQEIVQAIKDANVYDFIMNLPKGLDTNVGEGGAQLSGGQKQRIAIARALVSRPKILLLDEATSALDNRSEKVVQKALEKASKGRTTIVVSHRLSTVRNADAILAFSGGKVAERGTHEELMDQKGIYYKLVMRQAKVTDLKDEEDELPDEDKEELGLEADSNDLEVDSEEPGLHGPRVTRRTDRTGSIHEAKIDPKKAESVGILSILAMAKQDWWLIALGTLGSLLMGGLMPAYGWLFGEVMSVMSHDPSEARWESQAYAGGFLLVGLVAGIGLFLQTAMFAIAGENLTMRLRRQGFAAMLRQEIGWHDLPANNSGALCARLSNDASKVQGAAGSRIGTILQGVFTLIITFFLSLSYSWKLTLVGSVTIPVLIMGVMLQFKVLSGTESFEKNAFEKSASLAIDAITNIRTVAGLGIEDNFASRYSDALATSSNLKKYNLDSHLRGLLFGIAQSTMFLSYALIMYYGSYLINNEDLPYGDSFKVAEIILTGSFIIGQTVALSPDYEKGKLAAANIIDMLQRKSKIDPDSSAGLRLADISGQVDLREANFNYPTRKAVPVLKDFNLKLKQGQHIALVGHSGCGKSTCVQLIQRFYDLDSGALELDGHNVMALNVPSVRARLGVVSQEPTLFDRTIAENIMYGDNERAVTMEDVIDAARRANIHKFICNLPAGYDTQVGSKGTQLSGGQKQRIAIARALVRNPRILLLDEATSALDNESEKIVQDALNKAQENITSITIAHRLTTIKNADIIFAIESGEIVQAGTHDQLLQDKMGLYFDLWSTQNH